MSADLLDQVLSLSSQERQELLEQIRLSLVKDGKIVPQRNSREWKDRLMSYAAIAIGVDKIREDRRPINVLGRSMVISQLCKDGLTLAQIGILMDRDHSSVLYCRDRLKNMLGIPAMFGQEIQMWNNFQKLLNNETDR